eukprot:CAMPEP_0184698820 /NCGR_PEP_ID=MMETSP0313-20130426/5302_1 /TAXON_ID=2792 /ORGANISM="Porphyridium aerugineum, Strain SAG 1380-2" /LENGTH=568 /DNA_ID=CAMNT_0027157809 /DNA_START=131 /DNA_END=1837 /DNA_ORIENTATION=+
MPIRMINTLACSHPSDPLYANHLPPTSQLYHSNVTKHHATQLPFRALSNQDQELDFCGNTHIKCADIIHPSSIQDVLCRLWCHWLQNADKDAMVRRPIQDYNDIKRSNEKKRIKLSKKQKRWIKQHLHAKATKRDVKFDEISLENGEIAATTVNISQPAIPDTEIKLSTLKREKQPSIGSIPELLRAHEEVYPTRIQLRNRRMVVVGDLHGDYAHFLIVLETAKIIAPYADQSSTSQATNLALDNSRAPVSVMPERINWIANDTVLIQIGDQLDRGDDERNILCLLLRLQDQARAQGGDVRVLLGNHEFMNLISDLRYVSQEGFTWFQQDRQDELADLLDRSKLEALPPNFKMRLNFLPWYARFRAIALRPGGPTSVKFLSKWNLVLMVDDILFVHGALTSDHLDLYRNSSTDSVQEHFILEQMNADVRNYILGNFSLRHPSKNTDPMITAFSVFQLPNILSALSSPVWSREWSLDTMTLSKCSELEALLNQVGARMMIVGHTIQPQGINSACHGKIWKVDTGISRVYGGRLECLEIRNGSDIFIIPSDGGDPISGKHRSSENPIERI